VIRGTVERHAMPATFVDVVNGVDEDGLDAATAQEDAQDADEDVGGEGVAVEISG